MQKFSSGVVLRGLAGCCLLTCLFAKAQAPESGSSLPQAATITVNARIVVLDVVVTDKKGNLVSQPLTKDDFTVLEGGVPQTIRSFEPPSMHRMPVSDAPIVNSAADLKKIGDAPVSILVLDELNSRFEDSSFSRQMLIKYLESQPPVLHEPTVLMIAMNTTFQQMHDYTQNRDELIQVVKKHVPEYPWRMMNSGKGGPGAVERMAQVLSALQQIAQASQGTPGRKNLIWVGNGFPSSNLGGLPPDEAALIETAIKRTTARLLAARVTMYTINPTADSSSTVEVDDPDDLDTAENDNGSDPFGQGSVAFSNFATSTGGVAFTGRNDLDNVIREGIAKGQIYYTLSYRPTGDSTAAAAYRSIKIVMKDKNLHATTRDGYYPETAGDLNPVVDKTMAAKQVAANLKLDLSNALLSTISYNGLDLKSEKAGKGVYAIHVAENGIGWTEPDANGMQHTEDTVAAAWYDAKGKILGHSAKELTFKRGPANDGATYSFAVDVPSGASRLRFVVRDAINGHMGTVDMTKF